MSNIIRVNTDTTQVRIDTGGTHVIRVTEPGPRGPQGPPGPQGTPGSGSFQTGSLLVTGSVSNNIITLEKGDGTTFNLTVDTGSVDLSNYIQSSQTGSFLTPDDTGSFIVNSQTSSMSVLSASYALTASYAENVPVVDTGSLLVTGSVSLNVITLEKADGSTFNLIVDTGSVDLSEYVQNSATSSFIQNNQTSSMSVLSASYALTASHLTGYIEPFPYTGSAQITGSLDVIGPLGVDYIDFNTSSIEDIIQYKQGRLYYDQSQGALTFLNDELEVAHQLGQEFYVRVFNDSGDTILNGTPVYVSGAQGDRPKVYPAQSQPHYSHSADLNHILGLATHDIEDSTEGYVTELGIVNGIQVQAGWSVGDFIFVSSSVGELTNIQPQYPYEKIQVGILTRATPTNNGSIFVVPTSPTHLEEISEISASTFNVGDVLVYTDSGVQGFTNTNRLPNIIASGSFSGSFVGDGSGIENVVSASYAITASYALNGGGGGADTDWYQSGSFLTASADVQITGSLIISSSLGTQSGSVLILRGSGSSNPVFLVEGASGELFSITDSLSGSLFSVHNEFGLPILETFSDDRTLIGTYTARSLYTTAIITATTSSVTQSIYAINTSSYDGAFFEYTATSASNARAGSIIAIHNGGNVEFNETTTSDIGSTSDVLLSVEISASQMHLLSKTNSDSWKIKTIIRSI